MVVVSLLIWVCLIVVIFVVVGLFFKEEKFWV